MTRHWTSAVILAGATLFLMGAQCFSITDPLVVTVNVKDIKNTYPITPGSVAFNSPPRCETRNAADYIDSKYNVNGSRLVDVTMQTVGTFSGNVVNGVVTVNGTTIITYSGPWSAFSTPQSLLTSPLLVRNPAGVTVLLNAIKSGAAVTLCDGGQLSQASVAGMQIVANIYAQVDVTP